MSAVFSSAIGKFAFTILSFSGASLLTANILSSTLGKAPTLTTNNLNNLESLKPSRDHIKDKEKVLDNTSILASAKENQTPQYKNCKVVLTSKDENYRVLTCGDFQVKNNKRFKNWYLFDSKKGSLEKIDGLTTKNDTGLGAFESTDAWWKSKKWQGYRGRASHRDWGKEIVSEPFELKYVLEANSIEFPFFNYLRVFCQGRELRRYKGKHRFLDTGCSYFDIPAERFKIHLIEPLLKQAFGTEKEMCLIKETKTDSGKRQTFNWRENKENCDSQPVKK